MKYDVIIGLNNKSKTIVFIYNMLQKSHSKQAELKRFFTFKSKLRTFYFYRGKKS